MKRPSKPVVMITAGVVMVAASTGLGAAKLMEAQHPADRPPSTRPGSWPSTALDSAPSPAAMGSAPGSVTPGLSHHQVCEINVVPGWKRASDGIAWTVDDLANTIAAYGSAVTKPLPSGWTPEQLAAEAKKEIEQARARLDQQIDQALAGIASGGIPDWHVPKPVHKIGPCPDGAGK